MLNLSIVANSADLSRVGDGVVSKLEVVLVNHFSVLGLIIEKLQKSFVAVPRIGICFELAVAQEVLPVDTEVGLDVGSESLEVNTQDFGLNLSTQTWLLVIQGIESYSCALVLPESLRCSLHVAASHPVYKLS